jgi:hypothetical protein
VNTVSVALHLIALALILAWVVAPAERAILLAHLIAGIEVVIFTMWLLWGQYPLAAMSLVVIFAYLRWPLGVRSRR